MNRKIKYTTDGQKVVVIGKLNSTETIVQEIFVSDGAEIPSGEQFITKSLHDAPVESWKDKDDRKKEVRRKNTEREHDRMLSLLNADIETAKKTLSVKRNLISDAIKNATAYENHIDNEPFTTLLAFLSGEITHVLFDDWRAKIVTFEDAFGTDDSCERDAVKLLTLFGKSRDSFEWKISQYSDGSGSSRKIVPCKSYEDAIAALEKSIRESINRLWNGSRRGVQSDMLKLKEQYGLSVPAGDDLKEYYQKEIDVKIELIDKSNKETGDKQAEVSELQKKLEEAG